MDKELRDASRQATIDPEDRLREEAAKRAQRRLPLTLDEIKQKIHPKAFDWINQAVQEEGLSLERALFAFVSRDYSCCRCDAIDLFFYGCQCGGIRN